MYILTLLSVLKLCLFGVNLLLRIAIHIYRPQKKFAKVMFSQVPVCPQGHGISACIAGLQAHTQEGSPGPHPWGIPASTETSIPPRSRRLLLRTVRILLECILVFFTGFLVGGINLNCIYPPFLISCARTHQTQPYYYFTIQNTTDGHATCLPLPDNLCPDPDAASVNWWDNEEDCRGLCIGNKMILVFLKKKGFSLD